MRTISLLIYLSIIGAAISCNEPSSDSKISHEASGDEEPKDNDDKPSEANPETTQGINNVSDDSKISHEASGDEEPKDNGGKPWEANPETTQGINNMSVLADDFSPTDNLEDYKRLKEDLEAEFKIIFAKCSMTGAAHDQLHSYLFPLKRYFNELVSENPDERKKALKKLKQHLAVYSKFFK